MNKKDDDLEIDQKIYNLVYFRIHYQSLYEEELKKGNRAMAHLPLPTEEILSLTKVIVGWIFSNLAWDFLKKKMTTILESNKSSKNILPISESELRVCVANIRKALKDFDKLNNSLKSMLEEEAMVHYMTKDIESFVLEKSKKNTSRKTNLIKEMIVAKKESSHLLKIKFNSKEKVKLKKYFKNL